MYLIGKKLCPNCGIKGKVWSKDPLVFTCPKCESFFNEFGIVLQQQKTEETF